MSDNHRYVLEFGQYVLGRVDMCRVVLDKAISEHEISFIQ